MKIPRLSIASLMLVVALVAIDVWICQALLDSASAPSPFREMVTIGMMPMANLLILGLLPFRSKAGRAVRRPALVGFEIFGLLALVFVFVVCLCFTQPIFEGIRRVADFLKIDTPPALPISVLLGFLIPQVAVGLFGAWLMTKHQSRQEDRPGATVPSD